MAAQGLVNEGTMETEEIAWRGRPVSAGVALPPLGAVWLAPEGQSCR
jgi:1,4-alpha-glucan branching enzyme